MYEATSGNAWQTHRFDEMAVMVNDRIDDPSAADVRYYVGLEHLDSESLVIRRWGSPSDVEATKLRFRAGDIIFGRRRVYQRKLAVARFDGICSAHAMVLRAKPDVALPEFLPFFMQSDLFMERAKEISVGSLSPTINWGGLAGETFALPPLDEQRRIAGALRSGMATYEAIRLLLRQSLVVHRSNLADIQSSARTTQVRLGDLLHGIVPGRSVSGVDAPPSADEVGVLKVSAVNPDGFLPDESKRLLNPEEFAPEFHVRSGDLLITRANTPELVGEVCLVDRDHPNLMLCDKTLRLEPRPDVDAYLLWEALQGEAVRRQLRSVATGTGRAMKNISQPKIRELVIAYPVSSAAAEAAITRLRASRDATQALQERLDECKKLTRLLSGRLLWRAQA